MGNPLTISHPPRLWPNKDLAGAWINTGVRFGAQVGLLTCGLVKAFITEKALTVDSVNQMSSKSPCDQVMEMILAGYPARVVAPRLKELSSDARQSLLCNVCSMRCEIARNCLATANEVDKLLTAECPYFLDGVPTCLTE